MIWELPTRYWEINFLKKVTENKKKVTENKMITKLIKRGFYNNESSLGSFYKTNYYRPETIKTGETTETQILSGIKTKYFSTVWLIPYLNVSERWAKGFGIYMYFREGFSFGQFSLSRILRDPISIVLSDLLYGGHTLDFIHV